MFNSVNIVSILCILTIIGFATYSYLNYLESGTTTSFLTTQNNNQIDISECPDFFKIIDDNGNIKCENTYKLGKCHVTPDNKTISFDNDDLFTNIKYGKLNKCKWAKECEVPWQHINRLC